MAEINEKNYIKNEHIKEYIEDYWQERAESFSVLRKKELHSQKLKEWQNEIMSQLPLNRKLKILDIGCGAGFFSILLAKMNYQVTGIDLSKNMIVQSQKLANEENVDVDFLVMDAEKLEFDDETFDVIISRNLTWTLPHLQDAYIEWLRVLKPGGILLNYDGEHAKNHHNSTGAHQDVSTVLLEKCHNIYHMLETSLLKRPEFDKQFFELLGYDCEVDLEVGKRIYQTQDEFYVAVPLFKVKVMK